MSEYRGSVGKGIGIGALLTVGGLVAGAILVAVVIGAVVLVGIGIAQAAWIAPACISYRKKGESETVKGLLIAAGIVLLLNASCWGVFMTNFRV